MRMPDGLDLKIIEALQDDPTSTNKAIAKSLGVSETAIAQRIRSMSEDNLMRVVAQRDIFSGPYNLMVSARVRVARGFEKEVIRHFVEMDEVYTLSTSLSTPDLGLTILVEDRHSLEQLLRSRIGVIEGIEGIQTLIHLKIHKFLTDIGFLDLKMPPMPSSNNVNEKDQAIMALLIENGRLSNREIARQLGISESNVRQRLKKMADAKIMRLSALTHPSAAGQSAIAALEITAKPSRIDTVIRALAQRKEIGLLTSTSGLTPVFAMTAANSVQDLMDMVRNDYMAIDGVTDIQADLHGKALKRRHDITRIL
ncbi:MAG: Lrp/AsnC family transcriptional regulator [Pseudomonadota bacterium]